MKTQFFNFFAKRGLHTPPCSSHLFLSILMLFAMLLPVKVWGANGSTRGSFTQGETLYFKIDYNTGGGVDNDWRGYGAGFKAKFYSKDNIDTELYTTSVLQLVDGESQVYKITVPCANAGYVQVVRNSNNGNGDQWGYTVMMSVDEAGTRNCITQYAWTADPTPVHWTVYGSGRTATTIGPKTLDEVGDATSAGWNTNKKHLSEISTGIYWRKTHFESSDKEFKFLATDNWGDQYGPVTRNQDASTETVTLPSDGGYFSTDVQFINPDKSGKDHKFKTGSISDSYYNVVVDFAHYVNNGQNPKMFIFPLKIRIDYNGNQNTESAEINNDGDYVFTGLNIPANGTFKFCLKSDGTSTIGAASSELVIANGETKDLTLDGNNTFKAPSNKKITGLKVNLATRKVTITAVEDAAPVGPVYEDLSSNYYFRGDMWMEGDGWIDTGDRSTKLPKFVKAGDNKSATLTVLMPAGMKTRFTLCESGTEKNLTDYWHADDPQNNLTNSGTGNKTVFAAQGSTKTITYTITKVNSQLKLTAHAEAYTVKKAGWKLYVNGTERGTTNSEGKTVVDNLSGAQTFYFTDGSNTSDLRYGVNQFGALYVKRSESTSSILPSDKQYYKSESTGDFSAPLSDTKTGSGNGSYFTNPVGQLVNIPANSSVEFFFDGGKITVNVIAKHTVTFNTNGGSTIAAIQVSDGAKVTKPANPTKTNYGFVKWQRNGEDFDFNAAITEDIELTAVWATPFAKDEVLYFYLDEHNAWTGGVNGGHAIIGAIFYQIDNPEYCLETGNTNYGVSNIANQDLTYPQLGRKYKTLTEIGNGWYSITVPYTNAGGIRFVRISHENNDYMWGYADAHFTTEQNGRHTIKLTNDANNSTTTSAWCDETPYWTITFDMREHGEAIDPIQILKGNKATSLTTPEADGWNFIGWFKEDSYTNEFTTTSDVTGNMTIYAKWEENRCPSYSFHYGPTVGDNWAEPICFTQKGSTNEWEIENFVIDASQPLFYVGYQGYFYDNNLGSNKSSRSLTRSLSEEMYLVMSMKSDNAPGSPKVGAADGAIGTLRIYDDSNWNNLYVGFNPAGYGLMYGANGTENSIAIKATSDATVYLSDDITLTAEILSGKYQVGLLKDGGGYVACDNSQVYNFNSIGSCYWNGSDMVWPGDLTHYSAGDKGRIRIWVNNNDNKNWLCNFVPYWNLKYDLNGEAGDAPAGAMVYSEETEANRTVVLTATVPTATRKVFDGWYTEATGGEEVTGSVVLNGHKTLYAHWSDAPKWTVSFDSDGGSEVESQTIWDGETATEPSAPNKTDWSFKEWQHNGVKFDFSTPITESIELTAIWSDECDMTDVAYATLSVDAMSATALFNESMNSEPATITRTKIKIGNDGSGPYYAYDDNGTVKANTTGEYWIMEDAGKYDNTIQLYYLHNANNQYIYIDYGDGDKQMSTNGGWPTYRVKTSALSVGNNNYKWYEATGNWGHFKHVLSFRNGEAANPAKDGKYYSLHRRHWRSDWRWLWKNTDPGNDVACGGNITEGGSAYTDFQSMFEGIETIDNPAYLTATAEYDAKTYYRFATSASVSTTLPKALKEGDKITVYYHADAATAAELLINNMHVVDIAAEAGTHSYTYEVEATHAGQTVVAVASNNTNFLMAQIVVARPTPTAPRAANLQWNTDMSAGVNQLVEAGAFQHTATAKGAGTITYVSTNTDVATVAADGTVTPKAAGVTTIKAILEQDGCYEGSEISYTVTLTDLPKPTITFVTMPTDVPQGSIQNVEITTTAGANFRVSISGSDYTEENKVLTATSYTATIKLGASATDLVFTAATDRVAGEYAQVEEIATMTVSHCISDGADIIEFTLTGAEAANGQTATGLIAATVDQTALGTKGTDDNVAQVAIKKVQFDGQFITDVDGSVQVKTGKTDHSDEWYMIPAGQHDGKDMYYLKNVATGKYIYKDKSTFYGNNGDWKYYAVRTSATNEKTDVYKWFAVQKESSVRFANRDGYVSGDHAHTHNMRPCQTEAVEAWKTPYVGAGLGGNNGHGEWNAQISVVNASAANPDMFHSVEHDGKTYYIVSSEGSITIHAALKAGDIVKVDTYNRQTDEAEVKEITLDADASSYTFTTDNEYLCVNSIKVYREKVGEFIQPVLSGFAGADQLIDLRVPGAAVVSHTATTNIENVSPIAYSSSDESIAEVNPTTGEVTLKTDADGAVVTITATQAAVGCYNEATASYTITLENKTLQEKLDASIDNELTLNSNSSDDLVISTTATINGNGHTIGNLTVTETGNLTLSGALTVQNFRIESSQTAHISGQVFGAGSLSVQGNAYFDLKIAETNGVTSGWYAFTTPFEVSVTEGIYNANTGAKFTNERDYIIMQYKGDVRAQGQYGWVKTQGTLHPGTLYIIALGDTEFNHIRFQKKAGVGIKNGALVAVKQYPVSGAGVVGKDDGWNGVGNATLTYANAALAGVSKAQVLDHENNAFLLCGAEMNTQSFVVGSAFMVQAPTNDNMNFTPTSDPGMLLAPNRVAGRTIDEFNVRLGADTESYDDQLYLSASEDASADYEIGHDLLKFGAMGNVKIAQMAITGYGDMQLCDAEFPLLTNQVVFPLSLTAPAAGEYVLYQHEGPADADLYLVLNGRVIWNLSMSEYYIDLQQGNNAGYSLMLVGKRNVTTDIQDGFELNGQQVEKILLNGVFYIRCGAQMYDATGKKL